MTHWHRICRFFYLILPALLIFLSGCAEKTTVVLLPDPDGRVGQIVVSTDTQSMEMTMAGEATTIKAHDAQPSRPKILSSEEITAEFGSVLAVLPDQPVHFILYFTGDSTQLTADSRQNVPKILALIDGLQAQHISVVGHTDTAGDSRYNLELSQQRARAIRDLLEQSGVAADFITTSSHGEENLLVQTGDNVHEAKNRRVEVVVK